MCVLLVEEGTVKISSCSKNSYLRLRVETRWKQESQMYMDVDFRVSLLSFLFLKLTINISR